MRLHRRLLLITGINIIISFLFSFILDTVQGIHHDHSAVGMNIGFGWIFWLGIYTIFAPLFLRDEDKTLLFSRQYVGGTLLLLLMTILSTILTGYIAGMLVLDK
jgi:hypothetical protein